MEITIIEIGKIIVHTIATSHPIQIGIGICAAFVIGAFIFGK